MKPMKFIKPEHMVNLNEICAEVDGMIACCSRINNPERRQAIIDKLELFKQGERAKYSETEQSDGSVLVSHPAFAAVYIDEDLLDEPVRLFFSRVKSLSTVKISVWLVDVMVSPDGLMSYVQRQQLAGMELTQEEFGNLISHSSGQRFPVTYRAYQGKIYECPSDLSQETSRIVMAAADNVPFEFEKHGLEIMSQAERLAGKGGVLSQKARDEIEHTSGVLRSWIKSNPKYHAGQLAKQATEVANAVKMEVFCAAQLQGEK